MPEDEPTPEEKPKGKRKLWIIPAELPFSWDNVKSTAGRYGMNPFARRIVTGWFTTQMIKLRLDQVHTLLANHAFLADLIDENSPPQFGLWAVRALRRFINLQSLTGRLDDLITPELVTNAVRDANPDVFSLIVNSPAGGLKWFVNQTDHIKGKMRTIIEREMGWT
ncbi:hypothetical protein ES703_30703 [subsurface metagenome]|nr:hypothetical protein [bacterium]